MSNSNANQSLLSVMSMSIQDRQDHMYFAFKALKKESQYFQKCFECETHLRINVPIMCYTSTARIQDGITPEESAEDENVDEEFNFRFCDECYWRENYWKTDINPDNAEEIQEGVNWWTLVCEE